MFLLMVMLIVTESQNFICKQRRNDINRTLFQKKGKSHQSIKATNNLTINNYYCFKV